MFNLFFNLIIYVMYILYYRDKIHVDNFYLFSVASSSTDYCIHFQWSGFNMGPESSGRLSLFTFYCGAYLTVCLSVCLCLYLYLYLSVSVSVWAQNQVVGYHYLPSIVVLI